MGIGKFFKKASDKVSDTVKSAANTVAASGVVAGAMSTVSEIKEEESPPEFKPNIIPTPEPEPELAPEPEPEKSCPEPPVILDPILSCSEHPYNISNMTNFNNYPNFDTLTQYQRNKWLVCLNEHINSDNINNDNILDTYNLLYNNNETTNEMNKYSLYLYNNDVIYTYSKIILLFILGGTYFYFFKMFGFNISGIIDSAKKTISELPDIKKKIENKINIK